MAHPNYSAMTRKALREEGYVVGDTERFNIFGGVRQDLFNFVDMVAMKSQRGEFIGVQSTSHGCFRDHYKKITQPCRKLAQMWLQSGVRIQLWGWRKVAGRWTRKVHEFTLADFADEGEDLI